MIILVSDTSVLIDLERGGLLETVFAAGLPLVVPDLLYEQELAGENGPYLKSLGLGVVSLSSAEMQMAQDVRTARPGLSVADCFALSCAARPNHCLVTGDGLLRKEATKRLGEVYGLLWLLDQIEATGQASRSVLADGLTKISQHPRARLPKDEVQRRIDAWNT
ncbi:MAG: hypothetical protein KGO02_18600 [Alphaproteobacteria bacterium]|nr:hypothetical protein [Alphaproteobacteria bacterium]